MQFQPFSTPDKFTIKELQKRLKILMLQKFLPIFGKKRNAAIGESLEKYLGLNINRSRLSDWGKYELKTTTKSSSSKISLFNVRWKYQKKYNAKNLVIDYGKPHHSKHLNKSVIRLDGEILHSNEPLNRLYIKIPLENGPLTLNYANKLIASVERRNLITWFNQKFKNLVIVKAKSQKRENLNVFIIESAILLENTSFEQFIKLIHSNEIKLSFKLMLILPKTPEEKFNNRGSGFRASYNTLEKLYTTRQNLL